MSKEKEEKKESKAPVEKAPVIPVAKRQDLFEWLETLFHGEQQFPERIDVRTVSGKQCERLGPIVKQYNYGPEDYKAGSSKEKPGRDILVRMSNEIIGRCQNDCNVARRPMNYAVLAAHFMREVDFYERFLIRMAPQETAGEKVGEGDDEDEGLSRGDRLITQVLDHGERMFNLNFGLVEGIVDRLDRIMERQEVRISSQDERIAKQQEITERALSLDEDRAAKREWRTLAIKSADRIIETGARLGPSIVKSLTGKDLLPGGDPPEVIALRDFFKSKEEGGLLTEEQAGAAFGIWDGQEPHALKKPGVLSEAQGQVLAKVAQGEAPPSELDKLVPGGEHEITLLQAGRLQSECGFDVQLQLLPLLALFQARQTVKGVAGGKK